MRTRQDPAALAGFGAAAVLAAFITAASYPGFMSFDSLEALRQARSHVEGSQYPPFGSYVWRILDIVWPGPTLMQLFQNGLLLGSFAWVLYELGVRPILQLAAVCSLAAVPPITGTMLVVWKDVAVAAFFLAGFAAMFCASRSTARKRPLLVLAVILVFCGMAYRFNAASGALPLLMYAVWTAGTEQKNSRLFARVLWRGGALLLLLFAIVWGVNSFRFPSFERLERNTNPDAIMQFDLIGISRYSGVSLVPDAAGGLVALQYLKRIYDPRHLNITASKDVRHRLAKLTPAEIRTAWFTAVREHPLAYLEHRASVFQEYIGLHEHEVFYVTHPAVDPNELGITQHPNALTQVAVGYVWDARFSIEERPWIYYAIGIGCAVLLILTNRNRYLMEVLVLLSSGLLYLAPMFLIAPAADLRYNFWSIVATMVSIVFAISSLVPWPGRDPARERSAQATVGT